MTNIEVSVHTNDSLQPTSTNNNYDFPNECTVATVASTVPGGPTQDFLLRLRFCYSAPPLEEHKIRVFKTLLKTWTADDSNTQVLNLLGTILLEATIPTTLPLLQQELGYAQAREP